MAILKPLAAALAARVGYTVVPTWQLEIYPGLRHLRRILGWLRVDLVIDVGANAGQYRDQLRGPVGYRGAIRSFEPTPRLARALQARVAADPLWSVDPRALGAAPGTAAFSVMANTEFNSFLAPRHDEIGLFADQNVVAETVEVEVTTLDAELPGLIERHRPNAIYLKLDTQGFDLQVLNGAANSLAGVAALQVEASVRPIYRDAPTYRDIIDHLTARGFVMSGIFPNNEGHFPQLVEFDCHMIRRDRVGAA